MAKRSLRASQVGIARAKQAFQRTGWTQEYLAAEVGLETRQSIWKFFTGRPIERHLFIDICFRLNLDWEDIVELPQDDPLPADVEAASSNGMEAWVEQVRGNLRDSLRIACAYVQTPVDTTYPLMLEQVYTPIEILQHLNNQRWLEISDLQAKQPQTFDRLQLSHISQASVSALGAVAAYAKLMIFGKPGSGKTTFLQYLALQCLEGKLEASCIPVFITLRHWMAQVKFDRPFCLKSYIQQQWMGYGLSEAQVETLLQQGRALILLDGLDEVPQAEGRELLQQIQHFIESYCQNQIIITCRIAAQGYQLRGFTYVEIADFNSTQIEAFVKKVFVALTRSRWQRQQSFQPHDSVQIAAESAAKGLEKAEQFLKQLQQPENLPIRELIVTPILLHLTCLVFQERSTFPARRERLYQAGLDILLTEWDSARGIQRDQTDNHLSLPQKMNILSQIAATMFEQNKYFFEKSEILQVMAEYLVTLPNHNTDPETLWLESEAILRSITLQHGLLVERARDIYSFSHLTFQEYLTARRIVAHAIKEGAIHWMQLASHVTDRRWWEVLRLTFNLLRQPEPLIQCMHQAIQAFVAEDQAIQRILHWVDQKARSVNTPYQPAAVRAFYLTLMQNQEISLAIGLDARLAFDLVPEMALDLAIARTCALINAAEHHPSQSQLLNLRLSLDFDQRFGVDASFGQALQPLKAQLSEWIGLDTDGQQEWKISGQNWTAQFHQLIRQFRNLISDVELDSLNLERWQQYYQANQFLVECLNHADEKVAARQIEQKALLLLPIAGYPQSSNAKLLPPKELVSS